MPIETTSFADYLPVMTGLAAALAVVLVASVYGSRRVRRRKIVLKAPPLPAVSEWEEGETAAADRRGSVRREGRPVRVFVSAPALHGGMQDAWVLDRSTGGLRVAVPTAIPAESYVQVRAENAPDTVPWVGLVVRSCKPVGDHFELGCAFEQTPPWNVLLLFG